MYYSWTATKCALFAVDGLTRRDPSVVSATLATRKLNEEVKQPKQNIHN